VTELVPVPRMGGLALPDDPWDQAVSAFLSAFPSPRTRRAYQSDLSQWKLWCEARNVSPWCAQRVTADTWARHLEGTGLASSTTARKLSGVASLYTYLCQLPQSPALEALGWTWNSPMAHVKRPKFGGEGKTPTLTAEQLDKVLNLAMNPPQGCSCRPRGHFHGLRPYVAVLLCGTLAIRARELVTAKREDYTEAHGYPVIVVTRKGGKEQRLILKPPVAACLDSLLASRTGDLLVGTGNGDADYKWLYNLSLRLGKEAGLKLRLTPHVFRATFATLYLDRPNANLAWLQDFMGHADPRTTRLYDRGTGALSRMDEVASAVVSQLHI
jgi:integrase/recombinase XerD